jgi:hypothetical protein
MKRKVIVPKTVRQHIEKEFKKSPEFRKAYDEEAASLQDHSALISKPLPGSLRP